MIISISNLMRDLRNCEDRFIVAVAEDGTEYVIDGFCKRTTHAAEADSANWYYALKLRPVEGECLIR